MSAVEPNRDAFEAEVAQLLAEEAESQHFDRLWAKIATLDTSDVLAVWMLANHVLMNGPGKSAARIAKVAITEFCSRVALDEFGAALVAFQGHDEEDLLGRLAD